MTLTARTVHSLQALQGEKYPAFNCTLVYLKVLKRSKGRTKYQHTHQIFPLNPRKELHQR
jgi:hypothetical protein